MKPAASEPLMPPAVPPSSSLLRSPVESRIVMVSPSLPRVPYRVPGDYRGNEFHVAPVVKDLSVVERARVGRELVLRHQPVRHRLGDSAHRPEVRHPFFRHIAANSRYHAVFRQLLQRAPAHTDLMLITTRLFPQVDVAVGADHDAFLARQHQQR